MVVEYDGLFGLLVLVYFVNVVVCQLYVDVGNGFGNCKIVLCYFVCLFVILNVFMSIIERCLE